MPNGSLTAESGVDVDRLVAMLRGRRWTVLSGAGVSTDSGIPDYRGPTSVRATPMQYGEFVGSELAQRRYWARSYVGWRRIGTARPNDGHRALAALEPFGLAGIVTQNVDGLHRAAGSRDVVELHGDIAMVICLDCGRRTPRTALQSRLARLNPGLGEVAAPDHGQLRPDGDAVVHDWHDFVLATCLGCGGRLKPDVVFFGENVPKPRVEAAYALVEPADVLVVVGSSLTVMSGLRFVRHQVKRGRDVVIVNRGPTRGDELATIKLDAGCSETLTELRVALTDG
ncbi:NAD-dependent protein deacetylase [Microlunatus ginsengisoli]|uniref:NAD-dependent protein deacetylase n=1 Tax=Microlunatus ginsengisoli TaxID=363863 RepID=A0ABP7A9M1_9ACTN